MMLPGVWEDGWSDRWHHQAVELSLACESLGGTTAFAAACVPVTRCRVCDYPLAEIGRDDLKIQACGYAAS